MRDRLVSALDEFLWEHRRYPWPADPQRLLDDEGAMAAALYDAYKAWAEAEDRRVLSRPDFGVAVKEAGYEPRKVEAGHVYPGLTLETRTERARAAVIGDLRRLAYEWEHLIAMGDHRSRRHPEGDQCDHTLPPEVAEMVRGKVDAATTAYEADGTVDAVIARRYGAWLRLRHGDPNPTLVDQWEGLRVAHVGLRAEADRIRAEVAAGPGPEPARYEPYEPNDTDSILTKMVGERAHVTPAYREWDARRQALIAGERRLPALDREMANAQAAMATIERDLIPALAIQPDPVETDPPASTPMSEW